jgi:periplasmic protein TonB
MFDRLVLSTNEQRKGRTGKFLFVTALFYSLTLASALVVSVVAASPQLFETSNLRDALPAIPLAPSPPKGPQVKNTGNSNPAAPPDIYTVKKLDEIIEQAASTDEPPRVPPAISDINIEGNGRPGGGNVPGLPGGDGRGNGEGLLTGDKELGQPPPPPVPVQKPEEKPQPVVQKQPIRVPSTVLTGTAIERKTPAYPPLARQIRLQGSVVVEVVVSPEGRVESARALSGHPLLTKAAVDAANGWRFHPTLLNGIAVRVTGLITFNFNLN